MMIDDAGLLKKTKMVDDAGLLNKSEPTLWDQAKQLPNIALQEGRGAVNALSFGKYAQQSPDEQMTEASIMNQQGNAKGLMETYAGSPYKLGQTVGNVGALIAADMASGIAMPFVIAKYGLGAFKAAVASGALTGMLYEGAKGAFQDKSPTETTVNMAKTGLEFGGLGGLAYPINPIVNSLRNEIPKQLAQSYIPAPANMAKDILRNGEPVLGEQYLQTTKTPAGANLGRGQRADYFAINDKLDGLEGQLDEKLRARVAQATTPNVPNVPTPNPQTIDLAGTKAPAALEYNPGQVQNVNPGASHTGYGTIQPPVSVVENVPGRQIPFNGGSLNYEKGALGEQINVPSGYKAVPGLEPSTDVGGFNKTTEVGSNPQETTISPQRTNIGEMTKGLNQIPNATYKAGPVVDLRESRNSIENLAKLQENGGNINEANALREWAKNFGRDSSGRIIDYADLESGNKMRRWLDAEVGSRAHLQLTKDMNIMNLGQKLVADNIRNQVATQAPEVADILAQEHKFLNYKTALEPAAAGVRESSFSNVPLGAVGKTLKFLAPKGSEIGIAKGLQYFFSPNPTVTGLSRSILRKNVEGLSEKFGNKE